jgi:23S rRNA pseudouridine2605 synthase
MSTTRPGGKQRLQKILAAAGFGSRRKCEEMILDGRVRVNGARLLELPALADPDQDDIQIDGRPLVREKPVYYMLNKPAGIFCTNNDPSGRKRAIDLLSDVRERVFPVGRLDAESMGLLLFTNDGSLTQKLTHPRFSVPKTYRVEASGLVTRNVLEKLRGGVWLSEGRTAPAKIEVIHANKDRSILDVTLREGRNREIQRMLAKLGHNVRRMVRIKFGRLSISKLPIGGYRPLTTDEVKYLHSLADAVPTAKPQGWKPAPRSGDRSRRSAPSRQPSSAAPPRRTVLLPQESGGRARPPRRGAKTPR